MKRIQFILLMVLCVCCNSCYETEPVSPKNTFSICNQTDADVKVGYVISDKYAKIQPSGICTAKANETRVLPLSNISALPSELFERIVFLSMDGDTLREVYPIEDADWEYSESISDYGYQVANHYWTYSFGVDSK